MSLTATLERQTGRLPAELTSFIGRKAELEQVRRLIDGHRLVTLAGPGGVGKSRLAVRTASLAQDAFDDGVSFVGLSGLTEPSLLAQTICDALGLGERAGEPAATRLADHLAGMRLLLVLDTCEHLVDECAMLTEALLRAAPGLRVLATSRQPLDVMGEYTFLVAPLGMPEAGSGRPDAADGEECDSVKLFAERAAATVQGWTLTRDDREVVVRLCDRLDGIPLAIELAAVQLRAFSLDQVLGRLGTHLFQVRGRRTSLQRHQTLRATVDWSYELCSAEERLLWARLSVFATDFDLDAAEDVCSGDGLAAEHIVEVLTGLLEKSIVQRADRGGRVRYRMLETLREYGAERLTARGPGEVDRLRHRCFDWYAELLRRARTELPSAAQVDWLAWFGRERANIRAVLGQVLPTADEETIRDALGTLGRFWALNGILGESRHWMDRLLERRDTTGRGWSDFLTVAALTMTLQNDLAVSGELLERALAQARAEDDQEGVAAALGGQGVAALFAGDFDLSLQLLGTADEMYGEAGNDDLFILLTEVFRGLAYLFRNDLTAAITHAGQAVRLGEERGELWARSYGMLVWGLALWLGGDLDEAMERLRQALRIKRDLGDELGMTLGLEGIAGCLCSSGEFVRSAMLLGASDRMRESTQTSWFGPHHAILREIYIDQTVKALGRERFQAAFEEGKRLPLAYAIEDALRESTTAPGEPAGKPADAAHPLTEREFQVAGLVAEGLSNRDIAERLTIAKRTADSHVEHILAKLGYSSRAQIAVWITAQDSSLP
ncbi:LuxR C-terminal-related transcriptional regulator [Spirillospora sp. NPDC048819]|uniref:ATP-binding protein n=1 Tax=Spirillospora sp. NPDC048819 TaxID=3155268 RepID=UPI0033DD6487